MGYATFDEKFGEAEEKKLEGLFRKVFCPKLKKTTFKYASFDFESEDVVIELKSRRCAKDTYPTSMIGCNKIQKMECEKRMCFIVFNHTDGVYFWKYDSKEALKAIEYRKAGRTDRGFDERKLHCFIDNKYLLKIDEDSLLHEEVTPKECL
jgi:hypothetical protein